MFRELVIEGNPWEAQRLTIWPMCCSISQPESLPRQPPNRLAGRVRQVVDFAVLADRPL